MIPLLALLLACTGRHRPETPDLLPGPASSAEDESIPAGSIQDGKYIDGTLPFWISVLPGWRARPGPDDGALRVTLRHPASGVQVEVWSFVGDDAIPRPLDHCSWTFIDTGRWRAPRLSGPVTAATCTPADPAQPRTFAYVLARGGRIWQIESRVPPADLLAGKRLGDELIGTARWGAGED